MSRSVWKGPFVDPSLIKKVEKLKNQTNKTPIKTWSRKSTVIPEFVGYSFLIHNGRKFIPIKISEEMVGHKLGEFSPTRQFSGHTPADKKAAQTAAVESSSTVTKAKPATTKKEGSNEKRLEFVMKCSMSPGNNHRHFIPILYLGHNSQLVLSLCDIILI